MGMSPSQPLVHTFPPPPAQLADITPLSATREDHKMDISQHLAERVESWFGMWSRCMAGKQCIIVCLSVCDPFQGH